MIILTHTPIQTPNNKGLVHVKPPAIRSTIPKRINEKPTMMCTLARRLVMLASLTESAIFAITNKEVVFTSLTRICKSPTRNNKNILLSKPMNIDQCDKF